MQVTALQAAPVDYKQQLQASQQAVQGGGQADAHAVRNQTAAASTATAQPQALDLAEQQRKKAQHETADGQQSAHKTGTAEDSRRKKKKKKQHKKHSEDAAEDAAGATKCADPSVTHAAVQDSRLAGVQAAAQNPIQAIAKANAVGGKPDADTLKSGWPSSILQH